ncbi:MAG: hypothetical protein FJX45_18255 [Alphaproteobacteria bacterium]|nr:hypothetical protein [Alphaproteobacteria bacterium]MBM3653978.1 hypothetical protein [Alphaproteobacteria bacterium]
MNWRLLASRLIALMKLTFFARALRSKKRDMRWGAGDAERGVAGAMISHLDRVLLRDYRVMATAVVGLRSAGGALRLAIAGRGRVYFIDILDGGACPTDAHEEFSCWCMAYGTPRITARNIDDLRAALAYWRIATRPDEAGAGQAGATDERDGERL